MHSQKLISLTIPMHPTGKGRARTTKGGRPYTPKETRTTEAYISMMSANAMEGIDIASGPVCVYIKMYFAFPKTLTKKKEQEIRDLGMIPVKKPDIDNVVKSVMDAMNGIVWLDDNQVASLRVDKRYAEDKPRIEIVVSEYRAGKRVRKEGA